jgi:hypothetical protein
MAFSEGMFRMNGSSGTCVQKNGRCNTSENNEEQSIRGSRLRGDERYVERQVPRHEKDEGGDLPLHTQPIAEM